MAVVGGPEELALAGSREEGSPSAPDEVAEREGLERRMGGGAGAVCGGEYDQGKIGLSLAGCWALSLTN
jgi:hypothetical protein